MVVGVCRLRMSIPGNDSLKGKRSVIMPIAERVRARFDVGSKYERGRARGA